MNFFLADVPALVRGFLSRFLPFPPPALRFDETAGRATSIGSRTAETEAETAESESGTGTDVALGAIGSGTAAAAADVLLALSPPEVLARTTHFRLGMVIHFFASKRSSQNDTTIGMNNDEKQRNDCHVFALITRSGGIPNQKYQILIGAV